MENNYLHINKLSFKRDGHAILTDINMRFERGKITVIMGPSGCGKTTLLRLIGAQLYPDAGTIILDGEDVHRLSQRKLMSARRKIGMLFQSSALFTHLTVFENIAFPLREHTNLPMSFIRDIVLMKLQAVGLRGARDLLPAQLSGGMARRVALARAFALDPQLIMYDEPFTGQDPISTGVLIKLIKTLNEVVDITSIIVSHNVAETTAIADYIYLMAGGHIIGEGTPATLQQAPSPPVRQFMQGLADGAVPFHYSAKDYAQDLLND
ncbi:MAG: ATP-binding cassette domain-containing protein [Gammaproteobacteria bacterium]